MSDQDLPTTNRQTPLLLLLSLAAALAIGVVWLERQKSPVADAPGLPPELADEPDLYINTATIHQFRPDGSRKYLLKAATVNHFDEQALTRMHEPDLLLDGKNTASGSVSASDARDQTNGSSSQGANQDNPDDAPWRATSRLGYVRQRPGPNGVEEEVVLLREEVELSQTREPPRYLSMRTTMLYLYPDREFVETDESVTIDTHTGRTKAAGMRGNLATGVLRLVGDSSEGKTTRVQTIVLPFQFK